MRTTLALDDELVAEAQEYTGLREKSALVREALEALIQREVARRLAKLGGGEPGLEPEQLRLEAQHLSPAAARAGKPGRNGKPGRAGPPTRF